MTAELKDTAVSPVRLRAEARRAAWAAVRAAFPPRPVARDWPAAHRDRDTVLGLLASPPFAVANRGSQRGRLRAVAIAVGWLADQPGDTSACVRVFAPVGV